MTKPMLASDWDEVRVAAHFAKGGTFMMQPKVDGVRAMNLDMGLTGRSLKRHANVFVTNFFSQAYYRGFDGEMAAERETHPDLCRMTTSAMSRIEGKPYVLWWLFDYITPDTIHRPYEERYGAMKRRYWDLYQISQDLSEQLRIIPCEYATNMEQLEAFDLQCLDAGYEGTILRDPKGLYKQGRSTAKEGGLLRIKRFIEEEFRIDSFEEGQANGNEATIGPNGYTERSTHQANMVPNGMIGAFIGTDLKTGKTIKVAAGTLPHDQRKAWFDQPHLFLGKIGKYKTFPKGVKDKPRFPTFQSLKMESDL